MKPALILLAATLLITAFTPSFNAQSPELVCNNSPRTCLDLMLNSKHCR